MQLQFFSKLGNFEGKLVWGQESLAVLHSYCYLGVEFSSDGLWDKHINSLIICNTVDGEIFASLIFACLLFARSIFASILGGEN